MKYLWKKKGKNIVYNTIRKVITDKQVFTLIF